MLRPLYIVFSLALAALASCAHPRPISDQSRYTDAMFLRAIQNGSTAPDFVLITVVDVRNRTTRVVCTEAPFLEGALHREFAIPYDKGGQLRVRELALRQANRVYRFSRPDALRNVQPRYSAGQLDSARAAIAGRPDSELLDYAFVQTLFKPEGGGRDALAHALLERGISCARGCIVGDLNPYKQDSP